jgi:16S rRNA pseudouridine516 synthase
MFAAVGKEVIYLKRLSMGPLALDPGLPVGAWRRLTAEEIRALTEQ